MTDIKEAYSLNLFIRLALIVNGIIMSAGIMILFCTSDTCGVYAASICAVSALFNVVGLIQLLRWHYCGAVIVVFASLLSAIALSITCSGWLTYRFGNIGIYIPYIIMAIYMTILSVLLLLKNKGKSAWQQMDSSLDFAHFRHIYQLSSLILLAIIGIAFYVMQNNMPSEMGDEISRTVTENVSEKRLDSPDVTIEEIVSFEKKYNEFNSEEKRDGKITNRIFALKHLLLSGLMPDIHNRENLVNICVVHAGSFSEQQQEIIDWYLSLDITQQSEWNECDKVNTLSEFKKIVQNKIKKK